jgi:hypothetical protein
MSHNITDTIGSASLHPFKPLVLTAHGSRHTGDRYADQASDTSSDGTRSDQEEEDAEEEEEEEENSSSAGLTSLQDVPIAKTCLGITSLG